MTPGMLALLIFAPIGCLVLLGIAALLDLNHNHNNKENHHDR